MLDKKDLLRAIDKGVRGQELEDLINQYSKDQFKKFCLDYVKEKASKDMEMIENVIQ